MIKDKLGRCCKQPYSLIIVDQFMPKMNGIEMKKMLDDEQRRGQLLEYKMDQSLFVLSTAMTITERLNFDHYLEKPIVKVKLEELLFRL